MAYNNYINPINPSFASNPQYWAQQPLPNPIPNPIPNNPQNGIIWVQGEAGAKAFPMGPGANAILMDSEGDYFYIKSTDISGMPQPLRKFSYKEETAGNAPTIAPAAQQQTIPQFDPSNFVTRDEFEQRLSELNRPKYNNNKNYRREERNEQ